MNEKNHLILIFYILYASRKFDNVQSCINIILKDINLIRVWNDKLIKIFKENRISFGISEKILFQIYIYILLLNYNPYNL